MGVYASSSTFRVYQSHAWIISEIPLEKVSGGVRQYVGIISSKFSFNTTKTMTRREKKVLLAKAKYVSEYVLPKKEALYKEYLTDAIGAH